MTSKEKFFYLFGALILHLIVSPFLHGEGLKSFLLNISFSAILLTGVYAVSSVKKHLITTTILGGFAFLGIWYSSIFNPDAGLGFAVAIFSIVCQISFIIYVIILVLSSILRSKNVTLDTIYGAISVYLLIGFSFALFYFLIEILHPGSFYYDNVNNLDNSISWIKIIYFSFTTLTTLGYGDIKPLTDMTQIVSIIEAMLGVLYMAILIARLVGIFIAQSIEPSRNKYQE